MEVLFIEFYGRFIILTLRVQRREIEPAVGTASVSPDCGSDRLTVKSRGCTLWFISTRKIYPQHRGTDEHISCCLFLFSYTYNRVQLGAVYGLSLNLRAEELGAFISAANLFNGGRQFYGDRVCFEKSSVACPLRRATGVIFTTVTG